MSKAEEIHKHLESWALDELKNVSKRNFDLSKFFFAVSAATIGLVPLSERHLTAVGVGGVVLLVISALLAVCIAEPANFKISPQTDYFDEHSKYARQGQLLRYGWFVVWVLGIVGLVFGLKLAS